MSTELQTTKENQVRRWILLVLKGVFVGIGATAPGLSGGVLCLIFGIYAPLMDFLANPFRTWKEHIKWLIPFGVGVVLGFLSSAVLLDELFQWNEEIITCVCIGLILGELPSLFQEGGKEGRTKAVWWTFGIACATLLAFFFCINLLSANIVPNFAWYLLCGAFWGISIIVPGMSASVIPMNIGLYEPMMAGIASFDIKVLCALAIGVLLLIALLAKPVKMLFEKKYAFAYSVVIATIIAASVTTFPPITHFTGAKNLFLDLACVVGGAAVAYGISYVTEHMAKKKEEQ